MDITNKVKYVECEDIKGKFIQVTFRDKPIAEIRVFPGWFEGKKIQEVFKIFYCEDHPIDYIWINKEKKKRL